MRRGYLIKNPIQLRGRSSAGRLWVEGICGAGIAIDLTKNPNARQSSTDLWENDDVMQTLAFRNNVLQNSRPGFHTLVQHQQFHQCAGVGSIVGLRETIVPLPTPRQPHQAPPCQPQSDPAKKKFNPPPTKEGDTKRTHRRGSVHGPTSHQFGTIKRGSNQSFQDQTKQKDSHQ